MDLHILGLLGDNCDAVLLFITSHNQLHDLTPNFFFFYWPAMHWFLKVQLGSGGPGATMYMGSTITYLFDIFIRYLSLMLCVIVFNVSTIV